MFLELMTVESTHLAGLLKRVHPYQKHLDIGPLIGSNFPKAITPREVMSVHYSDPFVVRTVLGWSIIGPVLYINETVSEQSEVSCNQVEVRKIGKKRKPDIGFIFETRIRNRWI